MPWGFNFSKIGIDPGSILEFKKKPSETCEVLDDDQVLFRGESSFELKRPSTKKIPDINKDHNLKSFCLSKGHKAMIKKTIEKTIPKFLFVGSFIFGCIGYFTIFSSSSFTAYCSIKFDTTEEFSL